jgi:DTW domain-containing protein YfiP
MNNQQKLISDPRAHIKIDKNKACDRCLRLKQDCFCNKVKSFVTSLKVIILQHPQEQFKLLNSARLAHLALSNSRIMVGLSWPNFKRVAGEDQMPSQWGILYLKSGNRSGKPLEIIDRNKKIIDQPSGLKGIIALDGSWKQAKALWWRNPWFLKLNRISLNPDHPSLRKQTKTEGLSTIEAIAHALFCLGEKEETADSLIEQYENFIIEPSKKLPVTNDQLLI